MNCPRTLVPARGSKLGIGYDYESNAPVIVTETTPKRLIGVANAQIGEAVLTADGWYHVNDSARWSQEDDDSDCGQFTRSLDPDVLGSDFVFVFETPEHLLNEWMITAEAWRAKGDEQNLLQAALLYSVAEQLAWVANCGPRAQLAHYEAAQITKELFKETA